MRSQIEKFERVISFYKIDDATVKDLAMAICMADILHGTNDKKLSIHRLEASGVDCLSNLSIGGSSGVSVSPLPDVQVMRVMCDIIYYSLLFKGRVITGTHLTSGASNMVSKGLKRNDGSLEVASHDYCDFDECAKLLDVYVKKCKTSEGLDDLIKFNDYITKLISFCDNKEFLTESIKYYTRNYEIPVQSKYIGVYNINSYCDKNTINRIKISTTVGFMVACTKMFSSCVPKNSQIVNILLTRLVKLNLGTIGTHSMLPNIPSFDHKNIPNTMPFLTARVDMIFTRSKPIDYEDIPFLVAYYHYFECMSLIGDSFDVIYTKMKEVG